MSLLSKLFGSRVSTNASQEPQQNGLTCCNKPSLSREKTDMGHADSMEFILCSCTNCGAYWLNVFCVVSATVGHERVSNEDAALMLATKPGPERKAFIREWSRVHI